MWRPSVMTQKYYGIYKNWPKKCKNRVEKLFFTPDLNVRPCGTLQYSGVTWHIAVQWGNLDSLQKLWERPEHTPTVKETINFVIDDI